VIIAFDIDDTLGDLTFPALSVFDQMYNRTSTLMDLVNFVRSADYDPYGDFFAQLYGLSSDEVTEFFTFQAGELYWNMPSFPSAVKEAGVLKAQGYSLVYITEREQRWADVTENWLVEKGFPQGGIYFDRDKVDLAKRLGVNLFYEDSLANIWRLRAEGIPCKLVYSVQNFISAEPEIEKLYWNPRMTRLFGLRVLRDSSLT